MTNDRNESTWIKNALCFFLIASCTVMLGAGQEKLLSGTAINLKGDSYDENMVHSMPLIDFENDFSLNNLTLNDAKVKLVKQGKNRLLRINLGHEKNRPSVTFSLPERIDLSSYVAVALDITNLGSESIAIEAQCLSDKDKSIAYDDGAAFYYRSMVILNPGETDTMLIVLSRSLDSIPNHIKEHFKGMFGLPGGFVRRKLNLDLSAISHLSIFKQQGNDDWNITIGNIRALGKYSLPDEDMLQNGFFPFVDQFGQYMHSDWPHKVKNPTDIKEQRKEEEKDLAANPKPKGWNKYGGWEEGPTLKATGHFRVEKYNNKWWFVDPEGKLFWSQGLNIVTLTQRTQIRGREGYFSYTPPYDDFYLSNLMIKYNGSPTLFDDATENIHSRLKSWGMNTIAANSNYHLYHQPRTPYAVEIRSGLSGRLPDDFNAASFRESFREVLVSTYQIERSANDPLCIGYFIDNE